MSYKENMASKINDFLPADKPVYVAAYCRMELNNTNHLSSFELQTQYYTKLIEKQPNWIYSRIYVDEGKKCRIQFNAMTADAKAGKLDLIITKSVSRFSRNVIDCVSIARDLLSLKKSVGIYFENESICTLQSQAEITLTLLSVMAIAERENKGKRIGCFFPKGPLFDKK